MNDASNHIRLVAGFEIRPPAGNERLVLEREEAERLAGLIAEDLAHCIPDVTAGHLITGPALLEPGQIISPDHAPWQAMIRVAETAGAGQPGITAIGAHFGQLAHVPLMPYWTRPQGLFVCLPIVLTSPDASELEALRTRMEQNLFETGGLRPPAMGTLAEITGLDPVHGQLMTRADLMALVKVQLAGAGLDPFWPPVEHAVLEPQTPARLELPGGLIADWNVEAGGWELAFEPFHCSGRDAEQYALWLRAQRQTTTVLEAHLVRWRATTKRGDIEIDDENRWAHCDLGPGTPSKKGWKVEHADVGLVAYCALVDGRHSAFYPLQADAVGELERRLDRSGIAEYERTGDFAALEPCKSIKR